MSQHEFDLQPFLAPISPDAPCGADLRKEGEANEAYYMLRHARYAAQTLEREWQFHDPDQEPLALPDWEQVGRLAEEVLCNRSKDIEVCAYLIEAWVRLRGFQGLRQGFDLVRELVSRYWDELYPLPDEEHDEADRLSHLAGLNGVQQEGALIRPILCLPLTAETTVGRFCCADVIQARHLATVSEKELEHRVSRGEVAMPTILQAVRETPFQLFTELTQSIDDAAASLDAMVHQTREKAGDAAPSVARIREAIEQCGEMVRHLAANVVSPAPTSMGTTSTPAGPAAVNHDPTANPIRSREEALAMLAYIADFYRATEPHSPMSWATGQLISWGKMSLNELVTELIPDETARNFFRMRTGMQ